MRIVFDELNYRAFCLKNDLFLPIFYQPWWLDAVCPAGKWRPGCFVDEQGKVAGIWPVYTRYKFGLPCHDLPAYTPFCGPWMPPGVRADGTDLAGILRGLPWGLFHLVHCFDSPFETSDWIKNGFTLEPRHTYRLPKTAEAGQLFRRFNSSTQNGIRQAEKRLIVESQLNTTEFVPLYKQLLQEKKLYTPQLVQAMAAFMEVCAARAQGEVLLARDRQGNIQAGIAVVWDKQTTYNMINVATAAGRKSHAVRRLLWRAIQDAVQRGHVFDFEGGNIPGIGQFFASFGAEKMPYLRAQRYLNTLIKKIFYWLKP